MATGFKESGSESLSDWLNFAVVLIHSALLQTGTPFISQVSKINLIFSDFSDKLYLVN